MGKIFGLSLNPRSKLVKRKRHSKSRSRKGGSDREVCGEVIRQIKRRLIIGTVKWNERFANHKGKVMNDLRALEDVLNEISIVKKRLHTLRAVFEKAPEIALRGAPHCAVDEKRFEAFRVLQTTLKSYALSSKRKLSRLRARLLRVFEEAFAFAHLNRDGTLDRAPPTATEPAARHLQP